MIHSMVKIIQCGVFESKHLNHTFRNNHTIRNNVQICTLISSDSTMVLVITVCLLPSSYFSSRASSDLQYETQKFVVQLHPV